MPKTIQPKQVIVYADAEGYEPFTQHRDIVQAKVYWKEYQSRGQF